MTEKTEWKTGEKRAFVEVLEKEFCFECGTNNTKTLEGQQIPIDQAIQLIAGKAAIVDKETIKNSRWCA